MGKRSNFVRFDRDYYTTPVEGVTPLLPHIMGKIQRFAEPCAGNGALIDHIEGHDFFSLEKNNPVCVYASDIEPQRKDIIKKNALKLTRNDAVGAEVFITNPPWDRSILHPLIFHLTAFKPTWLLFDADWMHTKQSSIFQNMLKKVVSVGRIKWIKDSKGTGKDNCCWYLFDKRFDGKTEFYGRVD